MRWGTTASLGLATSLTVAGCTVYNRPHLASLLDADGGDNAVDATRGDDGATRRDAAEVLEPPTDAQSDADDASVPIDASDASVPIDATDARVPIDATDAADAADVSTPPDARPPDASCAVRPVADYCVSIPSLARAPVIDGQPDCTLALAGVAPLNWTGTAPIPAGTTAAVGVAWRPDGLYLFVRVTIATRNPAPTGAFAFCGDAVEIYVDDDGVYTAAPRYDTAGTRQLVVAAPPSAMGSVARGEVHANQRFVGAWTSTNFRAYATRDGYDIEALITGPDLGLARWTPAAAAHVGVDLAIAIGRAGGTATDCGSNLLGQFVWHVGGQGCGHPSCDVAAFCRPLLAAP